MIRVDNILVTKKNVFLLSGGHQYVADIESVKNSSTLGDSVDTNPWNLYTDDGKVISNLFDSSQFNVRTQITNGRSSLPNSNKDRHEEFFMPSEGKYVGICQVGDVGYSVSDKTNEKFRSSVTKYDMTESEYSAGYGFCQYYPLSTIEAIDANFIDPNIVYTPEGGAQYISEYPIGEFYSDFGDNDLDVEGSKIDVPTIYGDSFLTKYFYDGSYSVNGTTDGESIRFDNLRTYYGIGYNGDSLYLTYRNNFSTYSTKYGKYASRISADMADSIRFDFDTVGLISDCTLLTHHNADWSSISVYNGTCFEDENSMTPLLGGAYLPIRSFEPDDRSFILVAALKRTSVTEAELPTYASRKKFNAFVYVPRRGGFDGAKAKDLAHFETADSTSPSSITFVELPKSVIIGMRKNGSFLAVADTRSDVASSRMFSMFVPTLASHPATTGDGYAFTDNTGRSDVFYNGSDILAIKKYDAEDDETRCRLYVSRELSVSTRMPIGKVFSAVCSANTMAESVTSRDCIPYIMPGTRPIFDFCPYEKDIRTYSTKYSVSVQTYQTEHQVATTTTSLCSREISVETEKINTEIIEGTTDVSFVAAGVTSKKKTGTGCAACGYDYISHYSEAPVVDNSVRYHGENSIYFSNLGVAGEVKTLTLTATGPCMMQFNVLIKTAIENFSDRLERPPQLTVYSTAKVGKFNRKETLWNDSSSILPKKNKTTKLYDFDWKTVTAVDSRTGPLKIELNFHCRTNLPMSTEADSTFIDYDTWMSGFYIVVGGTDEGGTTYGKGLEFIQKSSTEIIKGTEREVIVTTSPALSTMTVSGEVEETTYHTEYQTHHRQIISSERNEAVEYAAKTGNYMFVQFSNGVVGRSHVDDIFTNELPILRTITCGPMNTPVSADRILTDIRFVSNCNGGATSNSISFDTFFEVRPVLMATYMKKGDGGVVGTVNSFSVYPLLERTEPIMIPADVAHTGSVIEYDGIRYPKLSEFFSGHEIAYSSGITMKSFSPSGVMHNVSALLVDWDNVGSDGVSTKVLSSENSSIGGLYLQYGGFCTELYIRLDRYGSTYAEDGLVLEGDSPVEARSGYSYPHPTYGDFATAGTGLLVFEGPFSNSMTLGDVFMLNNFLVIKNYSVEPRMVTPTDSRTTTGKNTYTPSPKFKSGGYVVADMNDGGAYSSPNELYEFTRNESTYYTDTPIGKFTVYPASKEGSEWAPFYSGKTIDFIKYGNGYYYIVMHDSDGGYEVVETPSLLEEQTFYRCEGGKTVTNIRFFTGYTVFEYSSEGEPYNTLYSPAGAVMRSSNFIVDGSGGTSERTLDTERTGLNRSSSRLVTYSPSATMLYGGTSITYVYGQPSMASATSVNAVTETSRYEYTSNATLTGSLTVYSTNMNGIYGNVYNSFSTTMACNSEIEVNDAAAPLSGLHNMFDKIVMMTDDMREGGYGVLDGNGVVRKVQNFAEEYSVISRNSRGDVYEYEKMTNGCYDFVGSAVISGRNFCSVFNRSNGKVYASTDYAINGTSYYCGSIFVELSGEYDNAVMLECYDDTLSDSISGKRFMLHRSEYVPDGRGDPTLSGYYCSFNPTDIISYTAAHAEIPSVSASVTMLPIEGPVFVTDSTIRYAAALSSGTVDSGLFFFGKNSVYTLSSGSYVKLYGYDGNIGEIFHPTTANDASNTRFGASFIGTSGNDTVLVGAFSNTLAPVKLGNSSITYKKACDSKGNLRSLVVYEGGVLKSYCEFESLNEANYSNVAVVSKYTDRTSDDISSVLELPSTSLTELSSYQMLDIDSNSSMYYGLVHEYNPKFSEGEQLTFKIDEIVRTHKTDTWTIPDTSVYLPNSDVRQKFTSAGWPSNLSSVDVYGKEPLFSVSNVKKDSTGEYSELTLKFNESKIVENISRVVVYRCNIAPWGDIWTSNAGVEGWWYVPVDNRTQNTICGDAFGGSNWTVETNIADFVDKSFVKSGQIVRYSGCYFEATRDVARASVDDLLYERGFVRILNYSSSTKYASDLFYTNPDACNAGYGVNAKRDNYPTCALRSATFDAIPFGKLGLASINRDYESVNDFSYETASSVKTLVDVENSISDTIYIPLNTYFETTRKTNRHSIGSYYYGCVYFTDGSYEVVRGSTWGEVNDTLRYCFVPETVLHTSGPYYDDGTWETYSYTRNKGTVDCKSILLKKDNGWSRTFYSDIFSVGGEYDYNNGDACMTVSAKPVNGNINVSISFKYLISSPYSYIESISSDYRGRRHYVLRSASDIDTYKISITSSLTADTPPTTALSSSTSFGLSSVGTLPTSSENRYVVITSDTLSGLCRATNVTSVPPSAGHLLGADKSVNNLNSFIKTSDHIALCNLDGIAMLCGSPMAAEGENHIRVFPISSFITYDYANLNTANSAITKSGDTAELNPTVQYSDVVGYDNVETVYSINRFTPNSTHKSNLFSVRVDDLGIDDSPYLSEADKENVRRWVKMHVREIVDEVKPANTELFDVILG